VRVLVTGNAGFIGFHVARRLIERGDSVVGFDVVNDYYDPVLKEARLAELDELSRRQGADYRFIRADLANQAAVDAAFRDGGFDRVIHLAAQAGVRYSLENPQSYVQSNLVGFTNILEACRHHEVGHLVYASTSSVYGANARCLSPSMMARITWDRSCPGRCEVLLACGPKRPRRRAADEARIQQPMRERSMIVARGFEADQDRPAHRPEFVDQTAIVQLCRQHDEPAVAAIVGPFDQHPLPVPGHVDRYQHSVGGNRKAFGGSRSRSKVLSRQRHFRDLLADMTARTVRCATQAFACRQLAARPFSQCATAQS